MPSAHVHICFGLMIAYFMGYRGKPHMKMSIFSVLADFDVFLNIPFMLILAFTRIDHNTYTWLNYLFGHRGISHSITFILIVGVIVYLVTKNLKTVANAAILMTSHLLLDYTITWELKLFSPFYMGRFESSTVEFMDPVINTVALLFIIVYIVYYIANSEKYRKKRGEKYLRLRKNFGGIVKYTFVFLCVFILVLFAGKGIGLYSRVGWENADYNETVGYGMYRYVYCMDHNETHWKVVSFRIFSRSEETTFVEKVAISDNDTIRLSDLDLAVDDVVKRCSGLLDTRAKNDQILDYYVLKISMKNNNTVKVNAYDARMYATGSTHSHSGGYLFEFENGELENFKARHGGGGFDRGNIPKYEFELNFPYTSIFIFSMTSVAVLASPAASWAFTISTPSFTAASPSFGHFQFRKRWFHLLRPLSPRYSAAYSIIHPPHSSPSISWSSQGSCSRNGRSKAMLYAVILAGRY